MEEVIQPGSSPHANTESTTSLSYKYQRLRERLRAAVASGELSGKLPGERLLARKFDVNPKTLSKALTDLAAEGLLDRSIGRGTYVKGSAPQTAPADGKWLIISEDGQSSNAVIQQLLKLHPDSELAAAGGSFRPSFTQKFEAVIDFCPTPNASLHRNFLVRGIPVIRVGRDPGELKSHAVLVDREYAAACLARQLLLAGHRRLLAIESPEDRRISPVLRDTAARIAPEATVESVTIEDLGTALAAGPAAVVCDGAGAATQARAAIDGREDAGRYPLVAIGVSDQAPCTGYYVAPATMARTVAELVPDVQAHRPSVLWLIGEYRQTTSPAGRIDGQPVAVPA